MYDNKFLELQFKKSLTVYNSTSPRIYGLPKLHKPNTPLRPVVSFTKAPTYNLSSFLAKILSCIANDELNIVNSRHLIHMLKNVVLDHNDNLVSFDAESLFTCIPVCLAIDIVKDRWAEIQNYTSLNEETFVEALQFCLEQGYCKFDNQYYSQVQGTAMGSPLSPIIADLVLDKLFVSIKDNFDVKFLAKYVDDSICIVNSDLITDIFDFMNNFHTRLKFTCEKEKDRSINFLDITITRSPNCNLNFKHYQKPTHTGRIINYHSNLPYHFKVNTATCLLRNRLELSDNIFHNELRSNFVDMLKLNDYPNHFINSILHGSAKKTSNISNVNCNTLSPSPSTNNVVNKKLRYFSIPFIGKPSIILKKYLSQLNPNFKITFSGHNLNQKFFSKAKDPLPVGKSSGLIYQIPCNNCNGNYIGETIQLLETRLYQHNRDVERKSVSTALCEHTTKTGHSFNFKKASILCYEENDKKRKLREAIEICKNQKSVNFKTDADGINKIFSPLIKMRHRYQRL